MTRSRTKPVRIIDHDPLSDASGRKNADQRSHAGMLPGNAVVFGKRHTEKVADAIISADRPYAKNGISEYFLSRVAERQHNNPDRPKPSAIRQPSVEDRSQEEITRLPLGILAAVAAIAFAMPMGLVFFTEQITGPGIDPMTTASVQAADGIVVRDVAMTKILKNGTFVVSINGKISNHGTKAQSLMPLVVSLLDEEGREVQSWRHRLGQTRLNDDATLHFRTSAIDYSGAAKTAHVIARTVK